MRRINVCAFLARAVCCEQLVPANAKNALGRPRQEVAPLCRDVEHRCRRVCRDFLLQGFVFPSSSSVPGASYPFNGPLHLTRKPAPWRETGLERDALSSRVFDRGRRDVRDGFA